MVIDLTIRVPQATTDYCDRPDLIIKTVDVNDYKKGSCVGFFNDGYNTPEFTIKITDLSRVLKHLSVIGEEDNV
jgi:hypothetical protein